MPKTRLTSAARDHLMNLMKETVDCPAERRALDKAYAKLAALVVKVLHAKHPPADMAILRKYDCAQQVVEVKLSLSVGGVVEFKLDPRLHEVWRQPRYGFVGQIYAADDRLTAAYQVWETAMLAHKKARDAKHTDYKALILGSRNLEEVEAIWPAASSARSIIVRNLPATLTPEAVERIKADVALQQRQKIAA
jgi:hypothetical protein